MTSSVERPRSPDAPFDSLRISMAHELDGLAAEFMERHPGCDAARWNIRQIVEHLILTYRASGRAFRERLEKGRPTQSRTTVNQRMAQWTVLGLGVFPPGREAPPWVTPKSVADQAMDGRDLAALFDDELRGMEEVLGECGPVFGGEAFASHQILGPLSVARWRRFHAVHGFHHLRQIRKLK